MLKLKNIIKVYSLGENKVEALKGINLQFRENEFVSILGPSGCGKTTMLNIIGGLDRYTSGDLIINNKSTKEYKDSDWDSYRNHSIGFVFQSYNLIPHLSVLGNVELALTISGVSLEERKKRAIQALINVGLEDHLYKKPNQLSGGQMQRVAIARALVNNPDILLADEPTGALDSKTSVQIMDLLKEIAKDKLVIMVTHNPDLANQYSNRIIELFDGVVINDSNPYNGDENKSTKVMTKASTKKTSMNFITAIGLSARNLITKKTRAIMTAFAGSIGIIGIALVLSLSNGFNQYIDKVQTDMMSSFPIEIAQTSIDMSSVMNSNPNQNLTKYPEINEILINKVSEQMSSIFGKNNITEEYVENVIKKMDKTLHNGIIYNYGTELNVYRLAVNEQTNTEYGSFVSTSPTALMLMDGWSQMLDDQMFVKSQYDVIYGKYPTAFNEIVVVVDEYNQISDITLKQLGLSTDEVDKYSFEDILNLKYNVLTNDELYKEQNGIYKSQVTVVNEYSNFKVVTKDVFDLGTQIKVVGILRPNKNTSVGSISGVVGYLSSLDDYIRNKNINSQVVLAQKEAKKVYDEGGDLINVTTGDKVITDIDNTYKAILKTLGDVKIPIAINIYPVSFEAKTKIKEYLDDYNNSVEDVKDKILYTDRIEMLVTSLNTMVDAISYVLIAFTAISLVVSSIMIAIITYVSVIERTKEIGILRSVGARKKDIARVFNAETFITGLVAGLFGVLITALLTIPINIILKSLLEGVGNLANLNIIHAILLIIISIILTLLSGLIPSIIAAKKDPVEALRTE